MQAYVPVLIILTASVLAALFKKLTVTGAAGGAIIALVIYLGTGYGGLTLLATFFVLGTLVTSWKAGWKRSAGYADAYDGGRRLLQVMANGGAAALFALCFYLNPGERTLLVMIASALASATADTVSSELGVVYGSRFYNIISLRRDRKGLDGVISVEGTLFGIAGSAIIAFVYCLVWGWSIDFIIIILAGSVGNIADSILGATAERKKIIGNNLVNFLNTLIAAASAYFIMHLVHFFGVLND